jgi:hypothetical protein
MNSLTFDSYATALSIALNDLDLEDRKDDDGGLAVSLAKQDILEYLSYSNMNYSDPTLLVPPGKAHFSPY